MKKLALIAVAALMLASPVQARVASGQHSAGKAAMQHSATMTRVVGTETLCVPHWRAFLRAHGSPQDAPGMFFLTAGAVDLTAFAFADADCRSVLFSYNYADWEVAISLYYVAEFVTMTSNQPDTFCSDIANFRTLRERFGIRPSVTVSDYFPTAGLSC